jgi:hypothetical protein
MRAVTRPKDCYVRASETQLILTGVSTEESSLTPELKDFIKRVLVPILVERYIEISKKSSPEADGAVL